MSLIGKTVSLCGTSPALEWLFLEEVEKSFDDDTGRWKSSVE